MNMLAQVTNEGEPVSWGFSEKSGIDMIFLPQIDLLKIKAEDEVNDKIQSKPYRVGISHRINYGLNNGGTWTQLANGDRLWRILFSSEDAINLSVVFDKFYLPRGGKIYLYNQDRTDLLGAYTEINNNEKQVLGTWFVKGDTLWIEYYEPKQVKGQGILNLSSIIHCYRMGNVYQKGYLSDFEKSLNSSGDCNHDVDCPIGSDFEAKRDLLKKAVGYLLMPDPINGSFICTGSLINNTAGDKTPYFLTANHCSGTDPALYSIRFNWISPMPICATTANSTNPVNNDIMDGAVIKAKNASSDFMLIQLINSIPPDWDVTYAGWDRTDADPEFEVSIHHPDGDIMKISRDDTGATKISSSGVDLWLIGGLSDGIGIGDGWEIGVTEGGSSGGPLFDQNGRIIGQLYGGAAACDITTSVADNNDYDAFGRFATSWSFGETNGSQLKHWLAPNSIGTNPPTLDALKNLLAVNDEYLEQNITIYPNPTSGFVQIKIREWSGDLDCEVYNMLGQKIKINRLQNNQFLDLSDLSSDIYFIKITKIDTNRSVVKKIILNN
jgi:hypothetical protein